MSDPEADAAFVALCGFNIGDRVGHADLLGNIGTIVSVLKNVPSPGKGKTFWLVAWNNGQTTRYFCDGLSHV